MRFADFGSWGKKPRVAPDSSDLSPQYRNKCEGINEQGESLHL